jgi:hypothetical protein
MNRWDSEGQKLGRNIQVKGLLCHGASIGKGLRCARHSSQPALPEH